jgi:hypothetical protein
MKKINKDITSASAFLLPFALFIGLGITKAINTAGSDVWISIIIGTVLGLVINYGIKKLPNKDSKICMYICNFVLLMLSIVIITKLISSLYLNKTSNLVVMLPFIILIFYTGLKNDYAVFKTTKILILIYFGLILFSFFSLVPSFNVDEFLPVLSGSKSKILLGALEYAIYSTTPLIVLPDFKEKYDYKVYLLTSLFLLIIFIFIIGTLGIELAKAYRYPEYMMFKNIAILNFIENIENILFFVWIINTYTLSAHTALNIKNIVGVKGLIITLIVNVLFINMVLIDNYLSFNFVVNNFDYILIGLLFIHILGKLTGKNSHKNDM